jgi:hypothetical protein
MKRCLLIALPALLLGCGQDGGDSQPKSDSTQTIADAGVTPDSEAAKEASVPTKDGSPIADSAPPKVDAAPPPDTSTPDTQPPPPDMGKPDTQPPCNPTYQGTYTAPFSLKAEEKVGSIVVNKMACSGTLTAKVACSQVPALKGSYTCNYSGGLLIFDKKQTGTIQGSVGTGGAFKGSIAHSFDSSLKKTYSVTGTVGNGKITGSGKGTLLPNPMSAVPWQVTFSF